MTVIYQTTITRIGASAIDALSDQMLITFREACGPRRVLLHSLPRRVERCTPSRFAIFTRKHCYPVTAVGSVAEDNLRELGHVTLRFDGLNEAEFPGTVHVAAGVF
ncbi:PTS glucitol/sorbitol transporter subunit IIA [Escherichia coli]